MRHTYFSVSTKAQTPPDALNDAKSNQLELDVFNGLADDRRLPRRLTLWQRLRHQAAPSQRVVVGRPQACHDFQTHRDCIAAYNGSSAMHWLAVSPVDDDFLLARRSCRVGRHDLQALIE